MNRQIRFCSSAILALCLLGCSTMKGAPSGNSQGGASVTTVSARDADNGGQFRWKNRAPGQVAPGYEVEITNPTDEQLNGKFRVSWDGVLKLPYDIRIDTSGLTERQLRQKIISAYTNFFQQTPTMNINVTDKKYYVEVRGLVQKPGQYLMREDSSLDEVVSAAGGLQQVGTKDNTSIAAKYVRVQQGDQAMVTNLADYYSGSIPINPRWAGGEVVFFQSDRGDAPALSAGPSANYIQVLGRVRTPGEYQYRPNTDPMYYLVKAGGPIEDADLGRIQIVRVESGRMRSIPVSLDDINEYEGPLPQVRAGDVIIYGSDQETRTERRTRWFAEIMSIVTGVATVVIAASTL